jgi:hypothetical protein
MPTLFNSADASAILQRVENLKAETQRQWGKMTPAQMLAHCNASMETAMGKTYIKPVGALGRFIGRLLRPSALGPKPLGRNSPTDTSYIMKNEMDFQIQKSKLTGTVKNFSEAGPAGSTKHPHPFFGQFSPEEWGIFAVETS